MSVTHGVVYVYYNWYIPENTFNVSYSKNNYIVSMQNLYENGILPIPVLCSMLDVM